MTRPTRSFWEELTLPPNLVSLVRLPLAAAFPFAVEVPSVALLVLVGAGATDVLDGWLARRSNQATRTGAIVDPVADKLFVGSVLLTLLAGEFLPPWGALMLVSREIVEIPLVAWIVVRGRSPESQPEVRANRAGKLATAFQFASVMCAIAMRPMLSPLLWISGSVGVLAGIVY